MRFFRPYDDYVIWDDNCFRAIDMFANMKLEKMRTRSRVCDEYAGLRNGKRGLAMKLFGEALSMIIDDVIDEDVEFRLYTGKEAYIRIDAFTDMRFKVKYKGGLFPGLDYLKTDFTGYAPVITYRAKSGVMKYADIVLPPSYRKRITEKVNGGYIYSNRERRTTKYYVEKIAALHPGIVAHDIERVLRYGFNVLLSNTMMNAATRIQYKKSHFIMYVMRYRLGYKAALEEYRRTKRLKIMRLARRAKIPSDGYFYFSVSHGRYLNYLKQLEHNRNTGEKDIYFGHVMLQRIFEMAELGMGCHFFKIKVPADKKNKFVLFRKDFMATGARYLFYRRYRGPYTLLNVSCKNLRIPSAKGW